MSSTIVSNIVMGFAIVLILASVALMVIAQDIVTGGGLLAVGCSLIAVALTTTGKTSHG